MSTEYIADTTVKTLRDAMRSVGGHIRSDKFIEELAQHVTAMGDTPTAAYKVSIVIKPCNKRKGKLVVVVQKKLTHDLVSFALVSISP